MYNSKNLPLSPKKIIKKTIARFFQLFPALVLFTIILLVLTISYLYKEETYNEIQNQFIENLALIIAVLITFLAIIAILIYEYFYYKLYFYEFTEERGVVRKGVISQATGYVNYDKLQNVYVDQDILDRIFGLYDVHYETAGETSGFYSHVDGLNKENAEKLVAFLEKKLRDRQGKSKKEDEVIKSENSEIESFKEKVNEEEISINQYPLSKFVVITHSIIFFISGTISLLILLFTIWGGIFLFGGYLLRLSFSLFLMILVINFILSLIGALIWYKNFYFRFDKDRGEIRSKVIGQSISYLYYDKIQNVNISQGFLGRILGIYTIIIETAGESAWNRLIIDGLTKESAEKIKDFLLNKAKYYRNQL